uniref:LRRCT domain-containing protein n=1 Tax=Branchiostoma floridae TaxID=7739 RepID=C3YNG5_BRAFL|eukprot:XP_002602259.1 hypothetical protein BRAFLDRAFT_76947 [Branchiostoma floridae]
MRIKLRHLLLILIILPEALRCPPSCYVISCVPSSRTKCLNNQGLTSIPQNLPISLTRLELKGTFANLPQLQELDLSYNKIQMIRECEFVSLPQLQRLYLHSNQITMIQKGSFANLPQLQELSLSSNQITMIQAGTFANLPQLQELDLSFNKIQMIRECEFVSLPQLQLLYLDSNQITMIQAGTFASLPQLQLLYLDSNQITIIQAGTFANLPQLQDLSLSSNQITMIQACAFVNLPKLKHLDLHSNMMSAIAPLAFDSLPSSLTIKVIRNPRQCDCKIALFWLTKFPFFKEQRICAFQCNFGKIAGSTTGPAGKTRATLTSPLATTPEKVVNCNFHKDFHVIFNKCYNGTTAGSTTGPEGKKSNQVKPSETITSPLQTTSDRPETNDRGKTITSRNSAPQTTSKESVPSFPIPVLIGTVAGSTTGPEGKKSNQVKPSETITSPLQTTSDRPETNDRGKTITSRNSAPQTTSKESVPSFPIPVLIGTVAGIALISSVIITIWCTRSYLKIIQARQGQSQVITQSNPNTIADLMTSGHDHEYEDIDKQRNQTRQGQSHAITQSNTNTTTALMTSDNDQQYEDIDKQHNQRRQGQSQAITKSNPNTATSLMTSDDDHQYEDIDKQRNQTRQGQSQAITQSNQNTAAALMTSGLDHQYEDIDKQRNQTRQGQS